MEWDYIAESNERMQATCDRLAADCRQLRQDIERFQANNASLIERIDRILATEDRRRDV